MSAKLSLKVKPSASELDKIFAEVESLAERENWSSTLVYRVNLVLEEIVLNTIDHGHHNDLQDIDIILTSEKDALTIEITDNGLPFDPRNAGLNHSLDAPLEERPIGGLGLYLVNTLMDKLHYKREEGRNHLTLVTTRIVE